MPKKRLPMQILIEFTPPNGADFISIREFITNELESGGGCRHPDDPLFHSLSNVKVSKPITAWRDPKKKTKHPMQLINFKTPEKTK